MKFDKVNPIHSIDENVILTEYGDISFCYKVDLDEQNTISIAKYNSMHSALIQMLSVLPSNVLIHRQDVFVDKIFDPLTVLDNEGFFNNSLVNHFKGRVYREQSSYLYITFLDSLGFKRNININKYFKKLQSNVSFKKKIDDYVIVAGKAIATISADFKINVLTESELKEMVASHFNGYEPNKVCTPFFKPKFQIGDKHFSIFGLDEDQNQKDGDIYIAAANQDLSSEVSKLYNSYLAPLGYSLNSEHVLNSFIFYDNQEAIKGELESNQSKLKGVKGLKSNNDVVSNRLDNFLKLVEIDNAKIVRCSFNVTLFNEDELLLNKSKKSIQTIFGKLGIVPTEFNYLDYPYIFISNTPGCGGHLPNEYTFLTIDQVAIIYSLYEGNFMEFNKDRGFIYCNRMNNIPYKLDTFFKPYESKLIDNRNYIKIAPSGGGKSFDQRAKAYQQYLMGFDQIVINIGGDEKMCHLINENSNDATYIKYEQGKTLPINPFYVEKYITNEKIEFLIPFIWLLWGGKDEISSDKESVLNKIIVMYYNIDALSIDDSGRFLLKNSDTEYSLNSFYDFILSNQSSISEIFGNDVNIFSLNSLKINLEKFAVGNYSNLFSRDKPSLFEKKKYVEFELDNIKDHPFLFTIFTMLISDITFNTMWSTEGYKDFFIDEAWKILEKKDSGMALLLKYLYKTIRKFDGGVGVAVQQITDLAGDVVIENAILGNCAIKHIYNHKNVIGQIPVLKEKLSLTDNDIGQLLSIKNKQKPEYAGDKTRYTEKLLVLGSDFSKVVRIETSAELAVIFDSEKSRLKKYEELYASNNKNIVKTVQNYLN